MKKENVLMKEFKQALLEVDRLKALTIIKEFHQANKEQLSYSGELIRLVLEDIGSGWEKGEVSLSQVYMSGIICEECVDSIVSKEEKKPNKEIAIGIGVLLDHHGLGKKIVSTIIRINGYEVIDLGEGVSINEMVNKAIDKKLDVLLISTLMLPSALKVKQVVEQLNKKDKNITVLAGGAPFRLDENLWKEVGLKENIEQTIDIVSVIESVVEK